MRNSPPPYRLTNHAQDQLKERDIPIALLERVLATPDEKLEEVKGRIGYQMVFTGDDHIQRLIRAIVEEGDELVVVTVYVTSKIDKYKGRK